jgi:phosphatidate cytidylyltransferase
VTEGEAVRPAEAEQGPRNLRTRVAAAAILAPLTVAVAYAGGWFWAALVLLAAVGLYVEWLTVVGARTPAMVAAGVASLCGACWIEVARIGAAYVFDLVVLGVAAAALLAPKRRGWAALGSIYAFAALIASLAVRADQAWGYAALMFVMLVVWVTDIGGYFAGRSIGGPKLWPRVSPKKTWAGAIGGSMAGLAVAAGFAGLSLGKIGPLLLLGGILSIVSQLGDLFESAVKRRFGVKDSSHIIPGHGGLMDRLDGFVAAIALAAILGFLRGGADGVGRGIMVW